MQLTASGLPMGLLREVTANAPGQCLDRTLALPSATLTTVTRLLSDTGGCCTRLPMPGQGRLVLSVLREAAKAALLGSGAAVVIFLRLPQQHQRTAVPTPDAPAMHLLLTKPAITLPNACLRVFHFRTCCEPMGSLLFCSDAS
eukprot:Rmarinus@m.11857